MSKTISIKIANSPSEIASFPLKQSIFLITFLFMLCISSMAQEVYLISYDSAGIIINRKYFSLEQVEKVMNEKFQKFKNEEVYFNFYIEKKRVNKNGKIRRIKSWKH